MKKKRHQLKPATKRYGPRPLAHKNPGPPAEPKTASPPVESPGISSRTVKVVKMLTAVALAAISLGVTFLKMDRAPEAPTPFPEVNREQSVNFLESGVIRSKPLRAERNGFTRSFPNGKTLIPAKKYELSYSVYDPIEERFLGTLTVPDASFSDPILIELGQPSAYWKPAIRTAEVTPKEGKSPL